MIGQGEARGCGMKGMQYLGKTEWSKVLFKGLETDWLSSRKLKGLKGIRSGPGY